MEKWSELADFDIVTAGVDTIGQQDHNDITLRIYPQGGASEPKMTDTPWGKKVAAAGLSR